MVLLLFLAACFLAYSNGANDNFKGVASLFGTRTAGYRTAIYWATVTTLGGSICAIYLAQAILKAFSGKGLVPDQIVGSEHFLLAVALGAGFTVIAATLLGLLAHACRLHAFSAIVAAHAFPFQHDDSRREFWTTYVRRFNCLALAGDTMSTLGRHMRRSDPCAPTLKLTHSHSTAGCA
jgi:hypothetical protein